MFNLDTFLLEGFKKIVIFLCDILQELLIFIFSFLPDGSGFPHPMTPAELGEAYPIFTLFIKTLSWCLPIQFMLTCISISLTALFALFCIKPFLRFLKLSS